MCATLSPDRWRTDLLEPEDSYETVTFLFTDIVDSTRMWDLDPVAMSNALDRHDAILQRAFDRHFGFVMTAVGDGFCVAFHDPDQAVRAAVEGLDELEGQVWKTVTPLLVRMAIHTGEAERKNGTHAGPALNLAARILSLANGDEILVSHTTRYLVNLDGQIEFFDLGDWRLRGLRRPERIYRLETVRA